MEIIYALLLYFGANVVYYESLPTCTAQQVEAGQIEDCAIN